MYIDADLARPAPRPIQYVPRENPTKVDPLLLCIFAIFWLVFVSVWDYMNVNEDKKLTLIFLVPFFALPFLLKIRSLLKERRLIRHGMALPALVNILPVRLPFGLSVPIYEVQAKYEVNGKTYIIDRLALDPTEFRGRYVSVVVDPRRPHKGIIYQISSYRVGENK